MTAEPKEQRRLVAIMFTDMVGYSALTQKNESLALRLLDESRRLLRPLFRSHHGKEIETVGDAFFVEFTSALDAARCAIEIQKRLRDRNISVPDVERILLRIGLHLGDVVQRGKHVHGDGVNIAARIEPLAIPGGICVSEDIARQVQNKLEIQLVRLGEGELKNIHLPVDIYRIFLPWEAKPRLSQRLLFGKRRKRVYTVAAAFLVVFATIALLFPFTSQSRNTRSIAVLPFTNMNDSQGSEIFSDGITYEVNAQLSKIGRLQVTSTASVMRYKNTEKSRPEIGRDLNVSYILQGSIRRAEDSVRILAQLIDAGSDEQLWMGEYNRGISHILAIQQEVATTIAHKLKAIISPEEAARLTSKGTESVHAYDLYFNGRHYWNKRYPPDTLKKSIAYFEQAIAVDSNFALAWAGLADAYVVLGDFNIAPPNQTYVRAKEAALRAMSIDNGLSEVHTSFAYALMHYDWDWVQAEAEFKQAIELNPSNARAHSWYGLLLTATGRFDQAIKEGKKALLLDPFSTATRSDAGLALYFARQYDSAIAAFKSVLQLDPTFAPAYLPLGGSFEQKQILDSARMAFSAASIFTRGNPVAVAAMCHAYAISGMKDDALSMLEVLEEKSKNEYVATYWKVIAHLGLGQNDRALSLLEQAVNERDGLLVYLHVDPAFDPIRSHPRFIALLEKLGLKRMKSAS